MYNKWQFKACMCGLHTYTYVCIVYICTQTDDWISQIVKQVQWRTMMTQTSFRSSRKTTVPRPGCVPVGSGELFYKVRAERKKESVYHPPDYWISRKWTWEYVALKAFIMILILFHMWEPQAFTFLLNRFYL